MGKVKIAPTPEQKETANQAKKVKSKKGPETATSKSAAKGTCFSRFVLCKCFCRKTLFSSAAREAAEEGASDAPAVEYDEEDEDEMKVRCLGNISTSNYMNFKPPKTTPTTKTPKKELEETPKEK